MIDHPPVNRSRLAKQENKRIAKQTATIIFVALALMIGFIAFGIPALMRLAVALGNAKSASKFVTQDDTLAPLPPQLNPLPQATSSATLSVEGYAEAGSIVTVNVNDTKAGESTADNQGLFTLAGIQLGDGDNILVATAKDAAGNLSHTSTPQTVTLANEPPELTIDQPKNDSAVMGELNQMIDINGSTKPNVQVTVNDRQLVVLGDGSFSAKYSLQEGDNTLKFVATDRAGNQTTEEIKVRFSR